MTRIFLSHSSADKEPVRRLADDLDAAGIIVWLDEQQIGVGDPISKRIQEGIATADYVAVWLTQRAVSSEWVQREWGARLNKEIAEFNVQILPLLAESCDVPILLTDKKYADFRESYDDGLHELLEKLGVRRHWTQEILEGYLTKHFRPEDFRQEQCSDEVEVLILSSVSFELVRHIYWNLRTNRLEVWERESAFWHGPWPLDNEDIQGVVRKLTRMRT